MSKKSGQKSLFKSIANLFKSVDNVDSNYFQTLATNNGIAGYHYHYNQYTSNPFLQIYVDLKVTDATRAGITFSGKKSFELNEEFKACKIMQKIKQALIEARICGGAGIIIVDDAHKGLDYPFSIDVITPDTNVQYHIFSSHQLQAVPNPEYDLLKEDYRNYEYYSLIGSNQNMQQKVHASRVIPFYGTPLTSIDMQATSYDTNIGWGRSIITPIAQAAEEFAEVYKTLPKIIKKANMDIISFGAHNDMASGNSGSHSAMHQSYSLMTKQINKMADEAKSMILPAGDYQRLSNNLTGYSDVIKEMVQFLASSQSYPIMYFMGLQQAGGLLNNASADMKKYAYAVHEMQENQIRENLNKILPIWCKHQHGEVYEDITEYEFNSIDVPSEDEKTTTDQKKLALAMQLFNSDLVSSETILNYLQGQLQIPITDQDIADAKENEEVENERLEDDEEAREST